MSSETTLPATPVQHIVSMPFAPYYEDDRCTIYHADCFAVLPCITFDVFVTDPPYGVALGKSAGSGGKHGLQREGYSMLTDSFDEWLGLVPPVMHMITRRAKRGAAFTGPHINEQPKAAAIGGVYCPAASGRHSWGFKTFLPVLFYGTAPNLHKGAKPNTLHSNATADKNGHPCPKPTEWMRWLVSLVAEESDVVVDPFMGSGTTLVAAKLDGRRAIGIEIEEQYCEIAAKRLSQGVLF